MSTATRARTRGAFDVCREWLSRRFRASGFADGPAAPAPQPPGRTQDASVTTQATEDCPLLNTQTDSPRGWLGGLHPAA